MLLDVCSYLSPTGQGYYFPSCGATFADCPPCFDNGALLGDSRLCLRGYVADAQPRRCCVVPRLAQGGGTGERLPSLVSFEKGTVLKMVRRTRLQQRCDVVRSRWLNRLWRDLCFTCLKSMCNACICVVPSLH